MDEPFLTAKAKVSACLSLLIFFTRSFSEVNTVHAFFVQRKTYTTLFWMSNGNLKHDENNNYEESVFVKLKVQLPLRQMHAWKVTFIDYSNQAFTLGIYEN